MDQYLQGYDLNASTWFYLSLLLILAVYFRFHRLWSLRNVDLCLILCASPGLLLVRSGHVAAGFGLLFSVTGILLLRLLFDPLLKRRPHTTQNLNPAGLAFLCASAFILLSMQAMHDPETEAEQIAATEGVYDATAVVLVPSAEPDTVETDDGEVGDATTAVEPGPVGDAFASAFAVFKDNAPPIMALAAHLAVIVGLLFVGRNLFGDIQLGAAMATLYMLLPATAFDVAAVNHVLPAALIVWAIVAYRQPITAGIFLGLACGALLFPLFLVPLWTAFYGRRGGVRFLVALTVTIVALLSTAAFTTPDVESFLREIRGTIQLQVLALVGREGVVSFWGDLNSPYRIPVMVAYLMLLIALTIWPREKTIEHLIAQSAALIVGTQFWYPQQGGVYLLWYLPILLMVIFRPRIAQLDQHRSPETIADVKGVSDQDVRPSTRSAQKHAHNRLTLFR